MSHSKIIVTGANGLVGSKFLDDFSNAYEFVKLDVSDPVNPIDITKFDQVQRAFSGGAGGNAPFVVHFAAYTDVTGAWKQRNDQTGLAYQVNVVGTHNIVRACEETGKHLLHISTAYVFDGEKDGLYTEADRINPIEWYGYTKAKAEEVVQSSECDWTILRIDQPFRSDEFPKKDIVHRIIDGLKAGTLYPQFTNHYFGPTFIDDFVKVVDWVVRSKTTGLFHASSGEKWSDYEFAVAVKEAMELDGEVKKGDLNEYLKTLERPYQKNTAMGVEKLRSKIDFKISEIKTTLKIV